MNESRIKKKPRYSNDSLDGNIYKDTRSIDDLFNDKDTSIAENIHGEDLKSINKDDFLNKSLHLIDEIEGIFKATIISINEANNGSILFTFNLKIDDVCYSIRAYYKLVLYRRSGLFRLASALNLLEEDDIKLSMFLNKEVWVSVKTNTVENKVYENIIDFANINHAKAELIVNENGYFDFKAIKEEGENEYE